MISMRVIVDGDGAWQDLQSKWKDGSLVQVEEPIQVACLNAGMQSGKPSVAFRFDLPDGRTIYAQTSLALFLSAGDLFKARYGDPR